MPEKKIVFFRNDDVGLFSKEPIASELINLTNLFIEYNVSICHGVVPDAVNTETAEWLRGKKSSHPHLVSIGQHGFRHIKRGKGEFNSKRSYQQQYNDIAAGMQLMKEKFGSDFSMWFSAPWIIYNRYTKKICEELGFRVFSGGVSPKLRARTFNAIGRFFNINTLGVKVVSHHRKNSFIQRGFDINEISVAIDVAEDYKQKKVKSLDSILRRFYQCKKQFNVIGFMLHQWIFDTEEKLEVIKKLLSELKTDSNVSIASFDSICKRQGS